MGRCRIGPTPRPAAVAAVALGRSCRPRSPARGRSARPSARRPPRRASAAAIATRRTDPGSRAAEMVVHRRRTARRPIAPRDRRVVADPRAPGGGPPRRPPRRVRGGGRAHRSSSTTKPCSMASSRPAVRSASRTPSPRRGALDERGGPPVASTSNDSAIAASVSPAERPTDRGQSRRTRRASVRADGQAGQDQVLERGRERHGGQLAPRGQDLLGDERDALRTARRPRPARSPTAAISSIAAMRRARSSRPRGSSRSRAGARAASASAARSRAHGSSRRTTSPWYVATMASRWERAIRARNVTSVRVAASARWRSSMTSSTGCSLAEAAHDAEDAFEEPRLTPLGHRPARGSTVRPGPDALGELGHELARARRSRCRGSSRAGRPGGPCQGRPEGPDQRAA